ncbi:hypothetical protein BVX98_06760, partial [bacterium F11]
MKKAFLTLTFFFFAFSLAWSEFYITRTEGKVAVIPRGAKKASPAVKHFQLKEIDISFKKGENFEYQGMTLVILIDTPSSEPFIPVAGYRDHKVVVVNRDRLVSGILKGNIVIKPPQFPLESKLVSSLEIDEAAIPWVKPETALIPVVFRDLTDMTEHMYLAIDPPESPIRVLLSSTQRGIFTWKWVFSVVVLILYYLDFGSGIILGTTIGSTFIYGLAHLKYVQKNWKYRQTLFYLSMVLGIGFLQIGIGILPTLLWNEYVTLPFAPQEFVPRFFMFYVGWVLVAFLYLLTPHPSYIPDPGTELNLDADLSSRDGRRGALIPGLYEWLRGEHVGLEGTIQYKRSDEAVRQYWAPSIETGTAGTLQIIGFSTLLIMGWDPIPFLVAYTIWTLLIEGTFFALHYLWKGRAPPFSNLSVLIASLLHAAVPLPLLTSKVPPLPTLDVFPWTIGIIIIVFTTLQILLFVTVIHGLILNQYDFSWGNIRARILNKESLRARFLSLFDNWPVAPALFIFLSHLLGGVIGLSRLEPGIHSLSFFIEFFSSRPSLPFWCLAVAMLVMYLFILGFFVSSYFVTKEMKGKLPPKATGDISLIYFSGLFIVILLFSQVKFSLISDSVVSGIIILGMWIMAVYLHQELLHQFLHPTSTSETRENWYKKPSLFRLFLPTLVPLLFWVILLIGTKPEEKPMLFTHSLLLIGAWALGLLTYYFLFRRAQAMDSQRQIRESFQFTQSWNLSIRMRGAEEIAIILEDPQRRKQAPLNFVVAAVRSMSQKNIPWGDGSDKNNFNRLWNLLIDISEETFRKDLNNDEALVMAASFFDLIASSRNANWEANDVRDLLVKPAMAYLSEGISEIGLSHDYRFLEMHLLSPPEEEWIKPRLALINHYLRKSNHELLFDENGHLRMVELKNQVKVDYGPNLIPDSRLYSRFASTESLWLAGSLMVGMAFLITTMGADLTLLPLFVLGIVANMILLATHYVVDGIRQKLNRPLVGIRDREFLFLSVLQLHLAGTLGLIVFFIFRPPYLSETMTFWLSLLSYIIPHFAYHIHMLWIHDPSFFPVGTRNDVHVAEWIRIPLKDWGITLPYRSSMEILVDKKSFILKRGDQGKYEVHRKGSRLEINMNT